MFPFGGFPSRAWGYQAPDATGLPVAGIPIRGSRVRRLPAPPPGISPLAAPFFGARAESSTARRRAMAPREEPAWYMLWAASAHRGPPISPSRISPKGLIERHPQPFTCPTPESPKGGDPAAPSGTATLLRLLPPRRGWVRPTLTGRTQ